MFITAARAGFTGRVLLPLLALGACLCLSTVAQAQECTDEPCGPIDWTPPTVSIWPGTGTYTGDSVTVTISWSDDYQLAPSTMQITYGTENVTARFTYSATNNWTATSTGKVPLNAASTTLIAYICDTSANCAQASVTYSAPVPAVRVSGDTATLRLPAGTYAVARYRVVNTGTASTRYGISTGCSGLWKCSSSSDSVTVAAGDSAWVDAYFATGSAGVSTTISLTASAGTASATAGRSVVVAAAPASGFVGDGPSMERIQRADCVTVSAGPAAASECGDLRLVHGLPGVRVLNKPRQPVLTYNSGHARPFSIVAEHLAGPAVQPDSIRAVLMIGTNQVAAGAWRGWAPGQVRRIAVAFDASSYLTGVYPYTLVVTAKYAGGTQETLVNRPGRMIIVNRSGSPFGAGWWLSGVEQLLDLPGDTVKLWVGGDGSARLYRRTGAALWRADDYDRPDSLYQTYSGAISQNVIVRRLPGGAEVWFSTSGIHLATANTVGHLTRFRWSSAPVGTTWEMRLDSLVLPSPTGQPDTMRYLFEYGTLMPGCAASTTGLTRVYSPAPAGGYRETRLCGDNLRRVTRITDPDSSAVNFLYSSSSRWITRRTDRRGGVTSFDMQRGRFNTWIQVLNSAQNAIARVHAVQSLGMNGVSVLQDSVNVRFDGPRPYAEVCDCVHWTVNRWGAPTLVRDPLGAVTQIRREDSRWPGLVTSTYAPSGFGQVAIYDARANLSATIDANPYGDDRNATTTYEWDPRWNAPTRIVLPEGEVTQVQYDSVGRPLWEQTGPNAARQVTYAYYPNSHTTAPGLAERVVLPGGFAERYEYDSRGNLSATVTPLGIRTAFESDRVGRPVVVRRPIEGTLQAIDSTYYNSQDRPRRSVTIGPAMSNASAQRLVVQNEYDPEGNLRAVSRWSEPDTALIGTVRTEFRYDSIGRKVAEIAPDGAVDSVFYDQAGNVVRLRSRRHAEIMAGLGAVPDSMGYIRMRYDSQNRLVQRITPPVVYQPLDAGLSLRGFIYPGEMDYVNTYFPGRTTPVPYPWYPTNTADWTYRIPGDTAVFQYHSLTGGMLAADNRDARIRRSYYANGALKGDTTYLRTVAEVAGGGGFTAHVYGLEHRYDRNGRRTQLKHPNQLAPSATQDRTLYGYDPSTGALRSVHDPLGNEYGYRYDLRGQPDTILIPGRIRDIHRYDPDGRLQTRSIQNLSTAESKWPYEWLRDATLTYDLRGKVRQALNWQGLGDSAMTAQYSGMGHLAWGSSSSVGYDGIGYRTTAHSSENSAYDALGNRHRSTTYTSYVVAGETRPRSTSTGYKYFRYESGTGRLAVADTTDQYEAHSYDAAGNLRFVTQLRPRADRSLPLRDRAFFYDAAGQLRATDYREASDPAMYEQSPWVRTFEEYRYDALGRRIWVRARRNCVEPYGFTAECKLSKLRRTVWDGDRELYEIQMPGGDWDGQYWENDTQLLSLGRVGSGPWPGSIDPNPYMGRVAYVNGAALDQPLGVIRMGYGDMTDSARYERPIRHDVPFLISPLWNERGSAQVGVFQDGGMRRCLTVDGYRRCVQIIWPETWFAHHRPLAGIVSWHGSLLEDKQDATGTVYRRNRYYDPASGRFTQEDPIGLAGGLNVYGFANGDPVSYSDPYGLCPKSAGGDGKTDSYSDCPAHRGGTPTAMPQVRATKH